ncbi:copper homeostasis protein CutC [Streptomyces sp. NPDC051320]|uniref:copper homeostasis protein CutC n=1 Tax=Streptomyces sp. NPDC051320 TaxID=3154644 RepID=UPI003440F6AB
MSGRLVGGPAGRLALEIAVTSAAGARTARDGGADRVELCSALELGGITPSAALVESAVSAGLPVHVLVRCRPGDFVYDAEEIALMTAEVRSAIRSGAAGVVIGALTASGTLDTEVIRQFTDAAGESGAAVGRPVEVTLHRAIDQTADPAATAAEIPALGLDRVLTSGGAATAVAGTPVIAAMVSAAPGIQVMAGAGVRPADIPGLAAATGVAAVHLSAKSPAPAGPRGRGLALGVTDSATHYLTDPALVRAAHAARTGLL